MLNGVAEFLTITEENLLSLEEYKRLRTGIVATHHMSLHEPSSFGDALQLILQLCETISLWNNRKPLLAYGTKICSATQKSVMAAFNHSLSLLAIAQLINHPGFSERKALSVLSQIHSLSTLLKVYEGEQSEEFKIRFLEEIQIRYGIRASMTQTLGSKLSKQIYKYFTSTEQFMCIK